MDHDRCTKHFPKRYVNATSRDKHGYPVYTRRDNGRVVLKSGVPLDNRYVVPHNRYLLMKYGAHINVEWCNQSRSIKYLFKYINKGLDRVTAAFCQSTQDEEKGKNVDEVKMYYNCRYISPCKAAWRIFGFKIQYRNPAVERLSFHLPGEQNIIFSDVVPIDVVIDRAEQNETMFLAWFEANKKYSKARKLTYAELPTPFVWKHDSKEWIPRTQRYKIGRIYYVHPGSRERYYLRCLLNVVRGPTCYEDIRTVRGVTYDTFRDACYALGLLDDDKEYIDGIIEASTWASGQSLRKLFATLLALDNMSLPEIVWNACWSYLSEDILYNRRRMLHHPELQMHDDEIKGYALVEIEKLLRTSERSLQKFKSMPYPSFEFFQIDENSMINEKIRYDRNLMIEEYKVLLDKLTEVVDSVSSSCGGVFFVYGYGGTGKTFVWRILSAALRSKGEIVLNVASSGIASLLLPGRRTAHSRFKIPLNVNEDSSCNITQGSPLAELIV